MIQSSFSQTENKYASPVFWAGVAVAIGAFGVVLTSIFYALSPVSAALPMPDPILAVALHSMIAGRATMVAAGTIGILADVILAAGTLLLLVFRPPASLQIERVGWALVTISVLIFVLVDSLSAGVLTQIAALEEAAAFAGFKLLFDTLFVLGTITFGLGVPAILVSEMKSRSPVLAKPLIWSGLLAAGAGLVSGLLYFAKISLPFGIGISIAAGAFVFGIYGFKIARS